MKNRIIVGACVLVVGLLIISSMPMNFNTRAAPAVPHNAYGIARDFVGVALPSGEIISSWIDGVRYNYGDNLTWNDTMTWGMYEIDTIGNYTQDQTPYIKEGGDYGEYIMYLWGDGTSSHPKNTIFEETTPWVGALSENIDLYEADMSAFPTFKWLKINNVTVDSAALGGIDYVQIYNPPGAAVNIFDYHFEKNDGQLLNNSPMYNITFDSLVMNPNLNIIPGDDRIWVNLSVLSGFNLDPIGDELKLVWKNPGTPGAPFAGRDVVVDRVEYSTYQNLVVELTADGAGNTATDPANARVSDGSYATINSGAPRLERVDGDHDGSALGTIQSVNLEVELTQSAVTAPDSIQVRWIVGAISGTPHTLTDLASVRREVFDVTAENPKWDWDVFDNANLGIQVEYVGVVNPVDGLIDQVNFNITYSTHMGEPDNTIMLDATAAIESGPGMEIYRTSEGVDTNDCLADFSTGNEFAWVPYIPPQVEITATHGPPSSEIRLNWTATAGAYGYMVYKDDPMTPVQMIVGGGVTEWTTMWNDYDDAFNHTYGVTSWGPGGENTFWHNNIAYKQIVTLYDYTGMAVKNGNVNYLALPFHMNLSAGGGFNDELALLTDTGALSVGRWNGATRTWESTFNFAPGEAYKVTVSSTSNYKAVGAHRNISMTLNYFGGIEGGPLNFISLPYMMINATFGVTNASGLLLGLQSAASAPGQVPRVARWDYTTGQWQSKTAIGIDFNLTPGEGYLVAVKETFTFGP